MTDKALFTPGPLTTSASVKRAMLRDVGSRDPEFTSVVREIRTRLLALAGVSTAAGFEAVILQGSGTFGVEAVLTSVIPPDGRLLVAVNGAYGERMVQIAARHRIPCVAVCSAEHTPIAPRAIDAALSADRAITTVALVHCETTTGLVNPAAAIGDVVRRHGRAFVLDAMSSFGGMSLDMPAAGVDFLVSSSNKCIEGVPGFAFVLGRRSLIEASAGWARTLSLALHEQWRGLEFDGQFRFTPPTHALLAFRQALDELDAEGGVVGRAERYRANHAALILGMRALGFRAYVPRIHQGHIITAFWQPPDPRFEFGTFYRRLSDAGFIIYPGKLGHANCFRIGSIGRLYPADCERLVAAIEAALRAMGVALPVGAPESSVAACDAQGAAFA